MAFIDVSTQALIVRELASGTARTLATGVQSRGVAWVSNDALVQSTVAGDLLRYSLDGAPPVTLYRAGVAGLRIASLAPTRNGNLIARANREGRWLLVSVHDEGRQVDSLYAPVNGLTRLAVVGNVILFTDDGRLWGLPLARNGRAVASERRELLGRDGPNEIAAFAASQSGSLLVIRSTAATDRELVLVSRDGRSTVAASQHMAYRAPRFAPTGSMIASLRTTSTIGSVWVTDLTRGTVQRAGADSVIFALHWALEGRRLLTVTRSGARWRVVSIAAEGGGSENTLLERPNPIYELQLTPDGRTLVWREDAPTTGRDIVMAQLSRPTESVPVRASTWDERGIALSRDGRWLAYTSNESGGNEVYLCLLEPNGPRWAVTRGGGSEPRWGANGELFYRKLDSVFALRVTGTQAPAIGAPALVAVVPSINSPYEPLWDVRPDGQQFVVVRQRSGEVREKLLVLNWKARW